MSRAVKYIKLPVAVLRENFYQIAVSEHSTTVQRQLWRDFYRAIRERASVTVKKAK